MPRPKSKVELLELSFLNYQKLKNYISNMDYEEQLREFPDGTMNRNTRDVLAHLHHWHLMMEEWYQVGMTGNKADMPTKGYTWKTTPDLNRWIWEKYNDLELEEVKTNLDTSFHRIRAIIEGHNNDELFEKKKYKWTGTTSLGAYLISATSSHYEWALKLIKKAKK